MADNIHLIGAEQIASAGREMNVAAAGMRAAASHIEDTMHRHQQFMTQWLADFNSILQENKKS